MEFQVVIPSHGRADRLVREALATLRRLQFPEDHTTVFVAPEQMAWYRLVLMDRETKAATEDRPDDPRGGVVT